MNITAPIALAICRSDATDTARWYHTLPGLGEHAMPIHLPSGLVPGMLVIDQEAFDQIAAAFATQANLPDWPGILVDREHASESPDGDSTAMAWARELQIRQDGIWTRWDITAAGEPLIVGRAFAYRSPAMGLQPLDATARAQLAATDPQAKILRATGRWRPVCLKSIALTNVPHFRDLTPALGRATPTTTPTETHMDRTLICQKLGLDPAQATDEQILGALDALVKTSQDAAQASAACKAAQDEIAAIKARALDADAAAFVIAHKARIKPEQEATILASYKANPDATKALFGALADAAPVARARLDASGAATPGERDPDAFDRGNQRAAFIATVAARDGISRREAVSIARREKPELWQ